MPPEALWLNFCLWYTLCAQLFSCHPVRLAGIVTAMLPTWHAGKRVMTCPDKAVCAAEALVPVHASQAESAMRQRLMSRLGAMQGRSATAVASAPAQMEASQADVHGQGSASVLSAPELFTPAPNGMAQHATGELRATR